MLNLRQRGFTLIEFMIAIMILGILLVAGAPSFGGWLQNQQIRNAAESMLNGMQLARSEAVKNNNDVRFVLCDAVSSWQVLEMTASAVAPASVGVCGAGVANEVLVQQRFVQEGSSRAALTVTPADATEVTFNSMGRVKLNADATSTITQIGVNTTVGGTHPLNVTVGAGGNLKMCDPSATLSANDPRHC